jgi:hypothetical protein
MNPTPSVQKPKIDNNALFAQRLIDNPPEHNFGELVQYKFKKGGPSGIGYITGRVFSENEKNWKYTIKPYALNVNFDDVVVIGKHMV